MANEILNDSLIYTLVDYKVIELFISIVQEIFKGECLFLDGSNGKQVTIFSAQFPLPLKFYLFKY